MRSHTILCCETAFEAERAPPSYNVAVKPLQRAQYFATTIAQWRKRVGVRSTTQWLLFRLGRPLGIRGPKTLRLWPDQALYAVTARCGYTSDTNVFDQIFVKEEYALLRDLKDVSLIMDLGANVGYASAYFLSHYPDARVLAVEPDDRNFAVCGMNLEPYGNRARVLHGAVWGERTELCLSRGTFGDGKDWATQVVQPQGGTGEIQAWDVDSLIDMAGSQTVDLLKIDIEGAELAVFSGNAKSWLPRIRNLCIELHGDDCRNTFFNALSGFDYELEHAGELTICRNIRPALSLVS